MTQWFANYQTTLDRGPRDTVDLFMLHSSDDVRYFSVGIVRFGPEPYGTKSLAESVKEAERIASALTSYEAEIPE